MARGTVKSQWEVAYSPKRRQHFSYDSAWVSLELEHWPAEHTFDATLTYKDYERGRSSVTVNLTDETGFQYTMFLAEFMRLVTYLEDGAISGTWAFEKNGSNTGIVRVGS